MTQSSTGRDASGKPLAPEYFEKSEAGKLGGDGTDACFQRYHQSKLANSAFVFALNDKIVEEGIDEARFKAVGAEPGWCVSDLGGNLLKSHGDAGFFQKAKIRVGSLFIMWRLMRHAQSPSDGSLPITAGMLAADVSSGDFFHPEKTQTGNPKKMIVKGELAKDHDKDEKLTLDKENQKLLWSKSEEALGKFFEFF